MKKSKTKRRVLKKKRKGIGSVLFYIVISFFLLYGIAFVSYQFFTMFSSEDDKDCERFYGKEYKFVQGDSNLDLCVNKNGEVRYYDLIK